MKGTYLKFYSYEFQKHKSLLLYEWLLEFAKSHGLQGGSVFRAIAGFGKHGKLHEEHFFELGGNLPIEIVFIGKEEEISRFLDLLKQENVNDIFYIKIPADFGAL